MWKGTGQSVAEEHLKHQRTRRTAQGAQEVLVEGWIPPTAIKGLIP